MMVYLQRWSMVAASGLLVTALILGLAAGVPRLAVAQDHSLQKPLADRSLLLDGTAVGGLMVAVGERGHVLLSRDEGVSWSQANVPTRAALTAVHFHDDQLGWAVGHDAVIVRTRDGGESWELLHFAPEEERPFLDVWFRDADNGFVIGAYGYFLKTEDGGDSWAEFAITSSEESESDDYDYDYGADLHLNDISRSASGNLYIAAEAGSVYRSDDGGESWVLLPSPYRGSFFGTLPLEGDALLLFGLRGHLFRSDDAGDSWQAIETGSEALLTSGLQLDDGTIVIAGLAGTLLVSSDGGRSVELRPLADRQGLTRVLGTSGGDLVTVGEFGVNLLPAHVFRGGDGR